MARILIVDDEEKLRTLLKRYALFEGHEVAEAGNGMEAIEKCQSSLFDIIIMDIMMPELDGFSAVKEIKKLHDIPVIMLSARGEEYDKIHGFELGIDDYVVKPFSSKEIMMRIQAVLKRTQKPSNVHTNAEHLIFQKEGLQVDMTAYKVTVNDEVISLATKTCDLLFFLIRNKNIAVPRERLLAEVWGYTYFGDDRTLDTHIKLLRRALGPYASCITTLRGLGYRFEG